MDLCHLENSELEAKKTEIQRQSRTPRRHRKRCFWFVCSVQWTKITIISNDSRKNLGHNIKASRMFRTSSRCSIRLYSGQYGRCINVMRKFQSQNVQMLGDVYQSTNGQNHGPVLKIRSFFGNEICTVILWRDRCGKDNLRTSFWNTAGRRFPIGNAYSYTVKKDYSYLCMWISNWQARQKTQNRLGNFSWKTLTWENRHHFLTMFFLGCTQRECQISKDIVANYRDMFETRFSVWAKEKLPTKASGKLDAETIYSWSYDMEGHAKKCVERLCELANKTTQELHKVATPCIDDHQFKEAENESVGELSTVCSQIVLKCLYNNMDKSLWQTFGAFDLLHSSYKWIPAILFCEKHSTAMQTMIVSRLWFLCIFGCHTFVPTS